MYNFISFPEKGFGLGTLSLKWKLVLLPSIPVSSKINKPFSLFSLGNKKNIATIQTVIRIPHFQIQIRKPKNQSPKNPKPFRGHGCDPLCIHWWFWFRIWIPIMDFVLGIWMGPVFLDTGPFLMVVLDQGSANWKHTYVFSSKTDKCKM